VAKVKTIEPYTVWQGQHHPKDTVLDVTDAEADHLETLQVAQRISDEQQEDTDAPASVPAEAPPVGKPAPRML
jgi:hypothetical protein